MEQSKKRALEDIERRLVPLSSKRRRQDETMTPSNPSIATSSPTLIGSPAPVALSRNLHPSTPSYSSSTTSSSASASTSESESESESELSESDASDSSSDETDSVDYASSSSVDSRIQPSRSHLPSHLLSRMISPSTTTREPSTDSDSYSSVSTSESISDLLSSSSDTTSSSEEEEEEEDDESISSSSASESSSSALSSFTSTHTSQPPPVSVASLTADNLSHLQARLNALLPKLKNANEVLETARDEGRLERWNMENVGEESEARGYIEMDLGLGVLEEKGKGGVGEYEEDEKDESEEEKDDGEVVGEGDVLEDMMGKRRRGKMQKRQVGIEEVRS